MSEALKRVGVVAIGVALAGPALFTQATPPVAGFETHVVALVGWGLWLAWLGWAQRPHGSTAPQPLPAGAWAATGLLAVLAAAAVGSSALAGWPSRLLWPHLAALAAAGVALGCGLRAGQRPPLLGGRAWPRVDNAVTLFLWALVLTGVANAVLAVAQHAGAASWWPGLMPPGKDGRPGGHLRHPSLLGTWLLWSMCALVALRQLRQCRPSAFWPLWAALLVGVVVSGSRTAVLGCGLLAVWALLDRHIERPARLALLLAPALVLLGWWLLWWWASAGDAPTGGTAVLRQADLTSSRGRLWQQAAVLVRNDPWTGVGFGQFNFAWTLTPMDGLPRAGGHTFTHAHNLFVHLAVELGLPATLLLALLMVASLLSAWRASFRTNPATTAAGRAAFVMVLVILLHSQLEFPLWQMHFLLPTAFLWGVALAGPPALQRAARAAAPQRAAAWRALPAMLPGIAMVLGGAFAMQQYAAISQVYAPSEDAPPDDVRIARAQGSWLYGHLGDRFDATLAPNGQRRLAPFNEVSFEMLDASLLAAWVAAHDENCEPQRADYLRARMTEFGWSVPARKLTTPAGCGGRTEELSYRRFR
jgi:O-antigen ligase